MVAREGFLWLVSFFKKLTRCGHSVCNACFAANFFGSQADKPSPFVEKQPEQRLFFFLPPPTVSGVRTKQYTKKSCLMAAFLNGSERGVRTPDTRIMIPLLYRLSYPAIRIYVFNNISFFHCQHLFSQNNKISCKKIPLHLDKHFIDVIFSCSLTFLPYRKNKDGSRC